MSKNQFSNSKLNPSQKAMLKTYKTALAAVGAVFFSYAPEKNSWCDTKTPGATVLVVPLFPGSKIVEISVAVCSFEEQKYREKVGEFHAAEKHFNGQVIRLPLAPDAWDSFAMNLHDALQVSDAEEEEEDDYENWPVYTAIMDAVNSESPDRSREIHDELREVFLQPEKALTKMGLNKLAETLRGAFTWRATLQGESFWSTLNEEIEDGFDS